MILKLKAKRTDLGVVAAGHALPSSSLMHELDAAWGRLEKSEYERTLREELVRLVL